MNGIRVGLIISAIGLVVFILSDCVPAAKPSVEKYLNLHDSVAYVGMETCISCHSNVHDTYMHTGMGRSFGLATPDRSDATFGDHALVYDTILNYYYYPFFKDSVLYIREFRLKGRDTIHNRVAKVDYIIGSGHHTNSHIINTNGYLYQAPLTYYTQRKKWDLAPGYEAGANSRFSRILTSECITCHNHFPTHIAGSENKYDHIPMGIACERCHGPGQLHVAAMTSGKLVDTARTADLTIVNPRRLDRDRQMDLCQRCHLQGVTVLQPGKTFYDFKPGMRLAEVMNVFLPRFSDSDERFLMASQADRLRLSACYLKSDELSCLTCHHPHKSVKSTPQKQYNDACKKCHQSKTCSAPLVDRKAVNDDCAKCHMPKSGSIDIPHVSITDHYIRKNYVKRKDNGKTRFMGLVSLTKEDVSPVEMAEGYIALYDKFIPDTTLLDSAANWLQQSTETEARLLPVWVHLYFAKRNLRELTRIIDRVDPTSLDAWTAYRLGETAMGTFRQQAGLKLLQQAVKLAPFNLDFREKYGYALGVNKKNTEAEKIYREILLEDPFRPISLTNLGYLRALQYDFETARIYYLKALAIDPDYAQAIENLEALDAAMINKRADRR